MVDRLYFCTNMHRIIIYVLKILIDIQRLGQNRVQNGDIYIGIVRIGKR